MKVTYSPGVGYYKEIAINDIELVHFTEVGTVFISKKDFEKEIPVSELVAISG